MDPVFDEMTLALIAILSLIIVILLGCSVGIRISRFCEELRYINMELNRCSIGERVKWRRRRRRLWMHLLIPFYRD